MSSPDYSEDALIHDIDPDRPAPTARTELLSEAQVSRAADLVGRLREGLGRAILGQDELLDLVVICLLARGHMLLEGLPGLIRSPALTRIDTRPFFPFIDSIFSAARASSFSESIEFGNRAIERII